MSDAPGVSFLALGDSYTIGEGVGEAERWPSQLAQLLVQRGVDISTPTLVARTGWTTDELADAIDASHLSPPYDLVSLLIGVNDQYRGRPPSEYAAWMPTIVDRAVALAGRRPDRTLVLSIPDWSVTPFAARGDRVRIAAEIEAYNAIARDAALRAGAAWIDVTPSSRGAQQDQRLLTSDGLHPAGAMYREWAALALPAAVRALAG